MGDGCEVFSSLHALEIQAFIVWKMKVLADIILNNIGIKLWEQS